MAARTYHHERWSDDDDRLLRSMCETGKSLTLMIVKLKRPIASIRSRAIELGLRLPGTRIGLRRKHKPPA
ncbi:hypothetical protein [Bradyrhizobium guangdongense]|uniref:Uncharacterized protein n=1 Tax=Bradyrhizobium guangdongense TaxID=1325090 RepID=A0A410V6Y4_9BRAD|nr:hypothetical protein [Bradyrhizobium guangdongense]QAU39471.1 hypothetical protein X265_18720 [Bradyrhizobium guangdongense]QOZ60530.1 hypothetical protein XH86_18730 [Bradyrhizobium guangdongense]GGI23849.1 hypothetical protein GCM10010987_26440 [Bradyrhizobium guangdongense]